jgi:hypothetical protein
LLSPAAARNVIVPGPAPIDVPDSLEDLSAGSEHLA